MSGFNKETVAWQLANLANSICFEQLPDQVVGAARHRLLDALACTVSGVNGDATVKVREAALALGGSDQATIIGTRHRSSIDRAALVNCVALRQLDFMDGHPGPYPAHASLNIPPILAVAEYLDKSGAEVALAIVLAYEFNIRLQLAAGRPDIGADGWNGSSILGTSCAIGMARLLGLSTDEMAHAIAIATTHAPTLDAPRRDQMPESKSCMDGIVAASSVLAVFMARAGLTGPEKVFEGAGGFAKAVSRRLDTDILLAPMARFRILDVYTKRYNAVKCAQTAVAAGLRIATKLPAGWRDIDRIELGLPDYDYHHQLEDHVSRLRPQTRDTANHSIFYCLAAGLVDGDLGPDQFAPPRLNDPDILHLIDRIELKLRPELDRHWPKTNPVTLEVIARGGKRFTETLLHSPGHPQNPLSEDELVAKFRSLAAAVLKPKTVDDVVQLAGKLEMMPSIRPLMQSLAC